MRSGSKGNTRFYRAKAEKSDRLLGKGSHGVLTLGDHRTMVRNPKDELQSGTLHGMLKQLELSSDDI
jgi:mRNA interferase HicA